MRSLHRKFNTDLMLFRGFILFLAAAMFFMANTFWSEEACPSPGGVFMWLVANICSLAGVRGVVVLFLGAAGYFIFYAFSDKSKKRVERFYN